MPELPEVETTRRGIAPHIEHQRIEKLSIREGRLRWPVPTDLPALIKHQPVQSVDRRGKYLLLRFEHGTVLLHLGMSGSLRVADADQPLKKHDHLVFHLQDGRELRFHDPRRFGCCLWTASDPATHDLIASLGPEPLSDAFTPAYLHARARGRNVAIKNFIMDSKVVVGVGNIYASESLYESGIHPLKPASKVSLARCEKLVPAIKTILSRSITQGGTTLRDFVNSDGEPGYFKQSLHVYGKAGEPCPACGKAITSKVIGQRSSFYCTHCQT